MAGIAHAIRPGHMQDTELPTQSETKVVWNRDAPEGKTWACTVCSHRAIYGGTAGTHALKSGHGLPVLDDLQPDELEPKHTTKTTLVVRAGDLMQVGYDLRMALDVARTAVQAAHDAGAPKEVVNKLWTMIKRLSG